ncbi:glycine-rich protein 1-like [Hetaerina americana]|uniref:glycine-rich protein 1-like n=1 Tax=Hetaerina americana TaxID=62018 RepID=UPI003A7F116E
MGGLMCGSSPKRKWSKGDLSEVYGTKVGAEEGEEGMSGVTRRGAGRVTDDGKVARKGRGGGGAVGRRSDEKKDGMASDRPGGLEKERESAEVGERVGYEVYGAKMGAEEGGAGTSMVTGSGAGGVADDGHGVGKGKGVGEVVGRVSDGEKNGVASKVPGGREEAQEACVEGKMVDVFGGGWLGEERGSPEGGERGGWEMVERDPGRPTPEDVVLLVFLILLASLGGEFNTIIPLD